MKLGSWNGSDQRTRIPYQDHIRGVVDKVAATKMASSMVVEYTQAEDANAANAEGLMRKSEMMTCDMYDKACRIKPCFRC